jgi:predicted nuclease of predicted toxin-antitoxin system
MNFLADVGISPHSVRFLRGLGHDAIHLQELGLERLPDVAILAKAAVEQRIVLTHDLDFGDLLAASHATLPSVVLFRLSDMRPDSVNRQLEQVLTHHGATLKIGAIVSVSDRRIRVRFLPIRSSHR